LYYEKKVLNNDCDTVSLISTKQTTSSHLKQLNKQKWTMAYGIGNPGPRLRQPQCLGVVKPVNPNWISNDGTDINKQKPCAKKKWIRNSISVASLHILLIVSCIVVDTWYQLENCQNVSTSSFNLVLGGKCNYGKSFILLIINRRITTRLFPLLKYKFLLKNCSKCPLGFKFWTHIYSQFKYFCRISF